MKLKQRFAVLLTALTLIVCCVGFVLPASAAEIHNGGRLWWKYDDFTYNMTIAWNDTSYDVPIYVSEYNGGITFFVDDDDVPDEYKPVLRFSTNIAGTLETQIEFDFPYYVEDSAALGGKKYYFITFDGSYDPCALPMSSMYELQETLIESMSTLYYLEDVELNAWSDAVDFFSVEFEKPPEPDLPPYVPEHWYEYLLVWVYDLFDALGSIFTGLFKLLSVDLTTVGDFFDALIDSENGVFGWLNDSSFFTDVTLFFGFVGDCLNALPPAILHLLRFGLGAGLGVAILKIISR